MPRVSAGQSMQETPEPLPWRWHWLRLLWLPLVGQQGCQFPAFFGLAVQPAPQVVPLAFHLFEFAAQPLKLRLQNCRSPVSFRGCQSFDFWVAVTVGWKHAVKLGGCNLVFPAFPAHAA